jgi:hypothetical protein
MKARSRSHKRLIAGRYLESGQIGQLLLRLIVRKGLWLDEADVLDSIDVENPEERLRTLIRQGHEPLLPPQDMEWDIERNDEGQIRLNYYEPLSLSKRATSA